MSIPNSNLVAIGLRAKTGRAIAVVLGGAPDTPTVLANTELKLSDPKNPATAQPYHEVMDLPWDKAQKAARKFEKQIETIATKALAELIAEQSSEGIKVASVGIVGAADKALSRIGNPHIRAHAAEGVLFRRVLEVATDGHALKYRTFSDREFEESVLAEIGKTSSAGLKRRISDLGRSLTPWRSDQKQAAMAAWLVLHSRFQNR